MSATYNVVTIGSNSYDVYADQATADIYLEAESSATAWRAALDDIKGRALVSATRLLDRQSWQGEKAEAAQELAWPRSGITDVDETVIPQAIIDATCELASAIVGGYDAANKSSTASDTKRQKAGSVEIEYFRSFEDGTRLPLPVHELISKWLLGATGITTSIATGTDGCSEFEDDFAFTRGF